MTSIPNRQPIWIVPLVIAGLVAAFGWWGNERLGRTIREQLKAQLTATLDANVTALEIWTTNQTRLATSLAEDSKARALATRVLEALPTGTVNFRRALTNYQEFATNSNELQAYLKPRLVAMGYEMAQLVNTNLTIVANLQGSAGPGPGGVFRPNAGPGLEGPGGPGLDGPGGPGGPGPGPEPGMPGMEAGPGRQGTNFARGMQGQRFGRAGQRPGMMGMRQGLLRLRTMPGGYVLEAHTNQFAALFASGEPVLITPYRPPEPGPGRGPRRGMGTNDFARGAGPGRLGQPPPGTNAPPRPGDAPPAMPRGRMGEDALMQVAAPVRDAQGTVRGALALIINPNSEFTRILSVARSGESGETYAFDQHGLLISRSRFEAELRALGLLSPTNTSSALNIRLRDPGEDLTKAARPEESESSTQALTRIVHRAVSGSNGVDVEPSRDYRGVPVVGAWRWLPQLGFGVATQMDASEAFRSLRVLQWLFISLFALLMLCASGMFVFSYSNVIWRRRLNQAELKLKQLGQYTLVEKIGEGGMGVVYRGHHALLRRDTAVKLLMPDRADSASIQRFEREVQFTCQLTHPNTIQIYDYGHTPDGIFYYAMEYLRGLNLHELVARFGPQPEGRVINILAQVCDSLAEAHALKLAHRDIKPANVFLCHRGGIPDWVKVLDFGLVREYQAADQDALRLPADQDVEGTPWFMPPESFRNTTHSDPRSDLYSVGALGYYLLTGGPVFDGESVQECYEKHRTQPPTPPSQRTGNPVSAEFERVILQCLEKDPARRPQTAGELRVILLASPRAGESTPESRIEWWQNYEVQGGKGQSPATKPKSSPLDVTVKIDFAGR